MKKLLITTDSFLPRWDGVTRFLSELIPNLTQRFDVTVVAPAFKGSKPNILGIKLIQIPLIKMQFGDIYFSQFSKPIINKLIQDADLIFNNTIGSIGITAIRCASKLKKPVISYIHSVEWDLAAEGVKYFHRIIRLIVKRIAKCLYNKCSLLLLPSKELEDILTGQGIKTKKKVIQLGVDTDVFVPAKDKSKAKAALGFNSGLFIVGFCGRISREKDLPTLFNAVNAIQKKHKNIRLLILGSGLDFPFLHDKQVIHIDSQKNIVPFIQAMDVYVLPSLTETSSFSTMEAMSCGIPVIVTPVGSIKEYVIDEETGLLFSRGDVTALEEKIDALYHSPPYAQKLGVAGRDIIVKKRQWARSVAKIITILDKMSDITSLN